MSLFSKEFLLRAFINLAATQEQIQSLAFYIRTFVKQSSTIVEGWVYLYNECSYPHKLNLLYLANEVLQRENKTTKEAIELKNSLRHAIKQVFDKTVDEVPEGNKLHSRFVSLGRVFESRKVLEME